MHCSVSARGSCDEVSSEGILEWEADGGSAEKLEGAMNVCSL